MYNFRRLFCGGIADLRVCLCSKKIFGRLKESRPYPTEDVERFAVLIVSLISESHQYVVALFSSVSNYTEMHRSKLGPIKMIS